MSALEERLRDAFRADAQTVRPQTIPDLPVRPVRRMPRRARSRLARLLIPLTAAAAVGAVVAGVSLASPLLRGHEQPPGASPGRPSPFATLLPVPRPTPYHGPLPGGSGALPFHPGLAPQPVLGPAASRGVVASASSPGTPPRFYVTFGGGSLIVRDTGTGAILGQVNAPRASRGFGAVAALPDDRTFLAAVWSTDSNMCVSELYQFQLNSQRRPGPLTPLNITIPGNFNEINTLAITPDGRIVAYDAMLCGTSQGEIGVINLATRQVRIWTTYGDNFTWALSLSADGRQLAFGKELGGAWVLNTSAPAGSVSQRARLVSRAAGWAALAGDGASLYFCTVSPSGLPAPRRGTVTYYAASLPTGHQQVIASWPGLPDPQCWASLDPSGRYLLVQYPVSVPNANDWVRPVILDLRSDRTTAIPAPAFYGPLNIAW